MSKHDSPPVQSPKKILKEFFRRQKSAASIKPSPGSSKPDSGSSKPDSGSSKPDSGSSKSAASKADGEAPVKKTYFNKKRAKSIAPGDEFHSKGKEFAKTRVSQPFVDTVAKNESMNAHASTGPRPSIDRSNSGHFSPEEFVRLVKERRNSDVGPHMRKHLAHLATTAKKLDLQPSDDLESPDSDSGFITTPSITVTNFDDDDNHRNNNRDSHRNNRDNHHNNRFEILPGQSPEVQDAEEKEEDAGDGQTEQMALVTQETISLVGAATKSEPRKLNSKAGTENSVRETNPSGLLTTMKNLANRRASLAPTQPSASSSLAHPNQEYKSSRRFSQPEIPSLQAMREQQLHRQRHVSHQLGDTFNNFPQITSDNSASRELSRYGLPSSGHYIIWKVQNKIDRIIRISNNADENANEIFTEPEPNDVFINLLTSKTIYDAMISGQRFVAIDIHLKVKSVFYVFNFEKIKSAPMWDGESNTFKGMLTVTDLINILLNFTAEKFKEQLPTIQDDTICKWRDILLGGRHSTLLTIDSEASLLEGYMTLKEVKVHRLLVFNSEGEALYIFSSRKILEYLYRMYSLYNLAQPPTFMNQTIDELKMGSYENLAWATCDMKLKDTLQMLFDRRISCVPVLNAEGQVINVYQKADVMNLVLEDVGIFMDKSMEEILKQERTIFEGAYFCKKSDSFGYVLETIVKLKIHRLIVVDDHKHLVGILSLSDVLDFLIQSKKKKVPTATLR